MQSLRIQLMLSIFLKCHKKWWKMLQNIGNRHLLQIFCNIFHHFLWHFKKIDNISWILRLCISCQFKSLQRMGIPVPSIRIPGVIRKSGESQLQIDNFKWHLPLIYTHCLETIWNFLEKCFSFENGVICIEVFVEWMDFDKINV
jgi:hypothetical protein